jgi:putative intracellular protease/amidase
LVQLAEHVPFLTEDELKKKGGVYEKAEGPFSPFVVEDQRLITGQNPASGGLVGEKVVQHLKK